MNLLIISSSQRKASQSAKVARHIKVISQQFSHVDHIDLFEHQLPFWDGNDASKYVANSTWPEIEGKLKKADALVLITPEWGGMASPLLKNFLLMADNQDTGHKPALLVAVVSGISGAYPIAELKMNAMKNNKLVATPDHLIIRNVEQVLNPVLAENTDTTPELNNREQGLRERIQYSIHTLYQYAQALAWVRQQHQDSPYPKQQEYCYGM